MSRTPLLTTLLWTTVGVTSLGACGDDPAPIVDAAGLDGTIDAEVGPLAQFAATLDLTAECGVAMPPTVDFTVRNVGNATLTISGATATNGFSVATAFPVDVAPGAQTILAIRPPASTIGTDVGGATKSGTLALNTNQPGTSGTTALTSTVHGANLVFQNSGGDPLALVDLAATSGACPSAAAVFIRNTGNLDAVVSSSGASGFNVTGFTPSSTVSAGSAISHDITANVSGQCTAGTTLQYQVTGTVCTTTPLALQASLNITGSSACFCS